MRKQDLHTDQEDFVHHWLISGPLCKPFEPPVQATGYDDQIAYEVHLRSVFYQKPGLPPVEVMLGVASALGMPWRYHSSRSRFLNENGFFSVLTDIKMEAATLLVSDRQQTVDAVLWSYMAVDLSLNGEAVLTERVPRYKPMRKLPCKLKLRQGENLVHLHLQNLGVRDARNMVALQLLDADGVTVRLPDAIHTYPWLEADAWLQHLRTEGGQLLVKALPPADACVQHEGQSTQITAPGSFDLHGAERVSVLVQLKDGTLKRDLELQENIRPVHVSASQEEDHVSAYCRTLAQTMAQPRSTGIHFAVFHVLARLKLGIMLPEDRERLLSDLDLIEKRVDCSDFLITGLMRLVRNYQMDDAFMARTKEVLLNYRYWMDEQGADGMCFWSENHSLMFHTSQMLAGEMYPEDIFARSGRTGREQQDKGRQRCEAWLDDAESHGMEEFNSASYLPVTTAGLLNLIDYGPKDLSDRAVRLMDGILRQLCRHVFDQSSISPQGRVYRDVITPHRQSVQDLLHYIFPDFPRANGENMWNVAFATSKYKFPEDLRGITQSTYAGNYLSGHARIRLMKTEDYVLTSVDCPRDQSDAPAWTNLCFVEGADHDSNTYTRSINERFHGTSIFEPGVYGYQQHLWYAALSNECVVFVNHPGCDKDNSGMRPGYWYGNGVFPALRQVDNALGLIYEIPDDYPIHFTHVYWPRAKFDRVEQHGQWLFGHARSGAVALWCSGELLSQDDILSGSEYRVMGSRVAYYCICAPCKDHGAFDSFVEECLGMQPHYLPDAHRLVMPKGYTLVYEARKNRTQII